MTLAAENFFKNFCEMEGGCPNAPIGLNGLTCVGHVEERQTRNLGQISGSGSFIFSANRLIICWQA
jgi:hypothetical protein